MAETGRRHVAGVGDDRQLAGELGLPERLAGRERELARDHAVAHALDATAVAHVETDSTDGVLALLHDREQAVHRAMATAGRAVVTSAGARR